MGSDILDILRRACQVEVDGYTFYSMTAERAIALQNAYTAIRSDFWQKSGL